MNHPLCPSAAFAALLVAIAPALGLSQAPDPDSLDLTSVHIATSLGDGPGGLEAHGPDFRAFLTDSGVRFEPALGRRAAMTQHLELATSSLAREQGPELLGGMRPAPRQEGERGVYAWGPGLEERWQVRPEGVEFSYWLETRPQGSGDLVARLALSTALPFAGPRADGGLAFELPGVGGVSIGTAIGIDAAGNTVPASLHFSRGELELRLPAHFVDSAVYPLLLDPLVGTIIAIEVEPVPNRRPDIAFDQTSQRYLAVWDREFSSILSVILARRLDLNGNPVGASISIPGGSLARKPRVANCNATNHFIVVYEFESTVHRISARTVRASDGALGPLSATVGFSVDGAVTDPDIGGQGMANAALPAATLVVWRDVPAGELRARRLLVNADGSLEIPDPYFVLATGSVFLSHTLPRISSTSGPQGRHLIVWRQFSAFTGSSIRGRVVGIDGQFQSSTQSLASLADGTVDYPDVDGLDSTWVVAWERSPDGQGAGISARRVSYVNSVAPLDTSPIVDVTSIPLFSSASRPTVAWTPQKSWVAWRQTSLITGWSLRIAGINSNNCSVCETSQQVAALGGGDNVFLSVATTASGGPGPGSNGMMVWSSGTGVVPSIFVQSLALTGGGGSRVNLGGGCGVGGTAAANTNPAIATPNFALQLVGTLPSTPFTVLGIAPAGAPFACGPCQLITPITTIVVPVAQGGIASFAAPIPCTLGLVGSQIDVQWFSYTVGLNPCPATLNFSASNRLRLTFGL